MSNSSFSNEKLVSFRQLTAIQSIIRSKCNHWPWSCCSQFQVNFDDQQIRHTFQRHQLSFQWLDPVIMCFKKIIYTWVSNNSTTKPGYRIVVTRALTYLYLPTLWTQPWTRFNVFSSAQFNQKLNFWPKKTLKSWYCSLCFILLRLHGMNEYLHEGKKSSSTEPSRMKWFLSESRSK